MSKRSLFRYWRELRLGPRILLDAFGCGLLAIAIEALISGKESFTTSLLFGAISGVCFALIDHITTKSSEKDRDKGSQK